MWYKKAENDKILLICRGLPGSGKSFVAKQAGKGGVIFSTDDFWYKNGEYVYDEKFAGEAHKWNQKRTKEAMENGISPIVVDNTNVSLYEIRPYVEMAIKHGYKVEYLEPNTPWKFDVDELVKRNTHGLTQEGIQKMLERWDSDFTTEDVLNSKAPWESE